MMQLKPIPDGFHTLTPYIVAENALNVIKFLEEAFGAKTLKQITDLDGRITYCEVLVGTSILMLCQANETYKATPIMFYVYVENTDEMYQKAINAGGISLMEPADMHYGDRNAGVQDSSGNQWWIATRIENLTMEETQKRENERLINQNK